MVSVFGRAGCVPAAMYDVLPRILAPFRARYPKVHVVLQEGHTNDVINAVREGRVVAAMHANDWDATDHLRSCVGREATDTMRDASIPLADVHG